MRLPTPVSILTSVLGGGTIEGVTGPLERCEIRIQRRSREGQKGMLEFALVFSDDVNLNAGVFNIWLDSTSNLQRLRTEGFPFEVRIHCVTPPFTPNSRSEWQMHRLMEAARETHMNFLVDWFPNRSTGAIEHRMDPPNDRGKEVLTVNLDRLTRRALVTASMGTFRKMLMQWRRYNEDREFVGDYAPAAPGYCVQ
jgi:hypothetical protein